MDERKKHGWAFWFAAATMSLCIAYFGTYLLMVRDSGISYATYDGFHRIPFYVWPNSEVHAEPIHDWSRFYNPAWMFHFWVAERCPALAAKGMPLMLGGTGHVSKKASHVAQ